MALEDRVFVFVLYGITSNSMYEKNYSEAYLSKMKFLNLSTIGK